MKNSGNAVIGAIATMAVVILSIGGWIANVVKLIGMLDDPTIVPMFIARCVGIVVAPLGVILGFF